VEDIFEKPWMGMMTGSIASIVIIIAPLPFILPFIDWQWPSWQIIGLALLAGALIQLSQGLYFQALSYSEAGIVAAYWNMVPAFVPLLSFVIFQERLSLPQYIAISVLIFASVSFCLIDEKIEVRWRTFYLMLAAAVMQACMFLLQEIVYSETSYIVAFIIITIGLIITGIVPLISSSIRRTFSNSRNTLMLATKLFIAIEVINLIALAFSQRAVDLGIPSLVAAVESTIPAYTFLLLIILTILLPKFGDPTAKRNITKKLGLLILMVISISTLA
jgi:drug/metabolite transporter (DMT)-like permease